MNKTEFKKYCNDYAYLYIIKLTSETESFYKIGITSNEDLSKRFNEYKKYYEIKIIKFLKHPSPEIIVDIERLLIDSFNRYSPKEKFGGSSECVKSINGLKDIFKSLKWIRDLEEIHFKEKPKKRDRVKILREYVEALDTIANAKYYMTEQSEIDEKKNFISDIESDASYELLVEFVKICKVSMNDIENYSNSYLRDATLEKKIGEEKAKQILSREIKDLYKVGEFYSKESIVESLTRIINAYQLSIIPKTSILETMFKIKSTTKKINGKTLGVILIEGTK
jgi:hypothetical protein